MSFPFILSFIDCSARLPILLRSERVLLRAIIPLIPLHYQFWSGHRLENRRFIRIIRCRLIAFIGHRIYPPLWLRPGKPLFLTLYLLAYMRLLACLR